MQKLSLTSNRDKNQTSSSSVFVQNRRASFFKPLIQPKHIINQPNDVYEQPNDKYEQEADAVADRVMRMPGNSSNDNLFFKPAISHIQRKCAHCEEEEKHKLQRKESANAAATADHELDTYADSLSGAGQPLSKEARSFFESRFGHDFSSVKVHTDAVAAKSAQSVNALAYTSGNNIVFGNGEYAPGTDRGKWLLGHELTHVVQQSAMNIGMEPSHTVTPAIQRAMVCSKRLEAPVLGWFFNHSYIDDTSRNDCLGASMAGNYAIQNLVSGNFKRGCATKTDTSTDPQSYKPNKKPCTPKAGVTNVSQCLRNAFNSYAEPSVYANPSGPNSNTFAATLASACCEDASSSGLGIVPGWDHAPAPPCEMVAQQPSNSNQPSDQPSFLENAYNSLDRDIRNLYGVP